MAANQELSAVLTKTITGIRRPFMDYAERFGQVNKSRAEIAPRFLAAFGDYLKESGGRGRFVDFVRIVDNTVPMDREGYRQHTSYQAAEYLRRLMGRAQNGQQAGEGGTSLQMQALARTLATVLTIVADAEALWSAVGAELGFKGRRLTNLRKVVTATKPLLDLRNMKPQPVKVIHLVQPQAAEPERKAQGRKRAIAA